MTAHHSFVTRPDDACPCGSGSSFGDCCRPIVADRRPPRGIRVVEDVFDPGLRSGLVDYADTRGGERLMVLDLSVTTTDHVVRKLDDRRVSEKVDLGPEQKTLNQVMRAALADTVEPEIGSRIEWFEAPQLLRYRAGGYFQAHADSESLDPLTGRWSRVLDRDISLLLYLNDDYAGGGLSFPRFDYILQPRSGMLVFFPSDHRYVHSAEPVLSGVRYAAVSWASLQGVPRIHTAPPPGALFPGA